MSRIVFLLRVKPPALEGGACGAPTGHGSKKLFDEAPKPVQKIDHTERTRDESEYPDGFSLRQRGDGREQTSAMP